MPDDRRAGHAGPRLERFRAENPAAARSIEAALAEYERRLREASEHLKRVCSSASTATPVVRCASLRGVREPATPKELATSHDFVTSAPTSGADALPAVPGNAAKLYCLRHVDDLAANRSLTILDLGCGSGRQLVPLLRRRPQVRYVGVEPNPEYAAEAAEKLAPFDAEILTAPAYDVDVPADVVLSFSVFEHVYKRDRYVRSIARNLREAGLAFVNYDAGHFIRMGGVDRIKAVVRRLLAASGRERYYQRFVKESEFRNLVSRHGLEIMDAKMFNLLKSIYHAVDEERRAGFMPKWLDYELYLNDLGIAYRDELASIFTTRNFILRHAGSAVSVGAPAPA